MPTDKPRLLTTVFSDYICPFCYVGDARLNRLREEYDLKINWCFIEIHPETPAEGRPISFLGYDTERWQAMMAALKNMAEEEGLEMSEHDFTTNSRQALLLAEAAKECGADVFYSLHQKLFEAFLRDGRNIGDEAVLRELALAAGMNEDQVTEAWTDDRFARRLRHNHAAAKELNVRATPTFFIGETRLDGAVPFEQMQAAARQAVDAA